MSCQSLCFLALLFRLPEGNAWGSATNSPILFYIFKDYVFEKVLDGSFCFVKICTIRTDISTPFQFREGVFDRSKAIEPQKTWKANR